MWCWHCEWPIAWARKWLKCTYAQHRHTHTHTISLKLWKIKQAQVIILSQQENVDCQHRSELQQRARGKEHTVPSHRRFGVYTYPGTQPLKIWGVHLPWASTGKGGRTVRKRRIHICHRKENIKSNWYLSCTCLAFCSCVTATGWQAGLCSSAKPTSVRRSTSTLPLPACPILASFSFIPPRLCTW